MQGPGGLYRQHPLKNSAAFPLKPQNMGKTSRFSGLFGLYLVWKSRIFPPFPQTFQHSTSVLHSGGGKIPRSTAFHNSSTIPPQPRGNRKPRAATDFFRLFHIFPSPYYDYCNKINRKANGKDGALSLFEKREPKLFDCKTQTCFAQYPIEKIWRGSRAERQTLCALPCAGGCAGKPNASASLLPRPQAGTNRLSQAPPVPCRTPDLNQSNGTPRQTTRTSAGQPGTPSQYSPPGPCKYGGACPMRIKSQPARARAV